MGLTEFIGLNALPGFQAWAGFNEFMGLTEFIGFMLFMGLNDCVGFHEFIGLKLFELPQFGIAFMLPHGFDWPE